MGFAALTLVAYACAALAAGSTLGAYLVCG